MSSKQLRRVEGNEVEDGARKKLKAGGQSNICCLCEDVEDRMEPCIDESCKDESRDRDGEAQRGGILSCRVNRSGVPRPRMTRFCFIYIDDERAMNKDSAFPGCPEWCKGLLLTFCQVNMLPPHPNASRDIRTHALIPRSAASRSAGWSASSPASPPTSRTPSAPACPPSGSSATTPRSRRALAPRSTASPTPPARGRRRPRRGWRPGRASRTTRCSRTRRPTRR